MPTRSALPQNYLTNTGTLFEDFENLADWTIAGGTGEANTTQFRTGTQSLKLTATADSGAPSATKTIDRNFAGQRAFSIWIYAHTANTENWVVWVDFSSTTDFSKRLRAIITSDSWLIQNQWMKLILHQDDFVTTTGELWTNQMIRMKITAYSDGGHRNILSFDDFRYGEEGLPRLVISFDDGYKNDIGGGDTAYSYMTNRGLRGTIYLESAWVDKVGYYFTLAELQALYAQGWAIANHTITHAHLDTLSASAIQAEIKGCTDYLIANGMPRAAYHLAYPNGSWNDTVLAVMASTRMLTGRTALNFYQSTPVGNYYLINAKLVLNTYSLATVMGFIETAIRNQVSLHLVFHRIVTTPVDSVEWSITNYKALIDYIVARKIKCVTIDEFYKGLTSPRYRSLLLSRP